VEAKGRVFLDHSEEPYKAIGTLRDITQEKHRQQELIKSEIKFRLLADSMAQFIWTADPMGNLTYFNQAVYQYSGLSTNALAELGWIQIVHPEEREKNITQWIESIRTGRPFYYEHRFRRHDGVYRWQMSRAVPQMDDEGQIQMWVGTSTDIEDQKIFASELERQVRERTNELIVKNRELNKMNAELESFAYISSHDLQEPLRKIQIFASMVAEEEQHVLSKNAKHYFERIQASAHRMQVLIEDLLSYSRLGATSSVFTNTDLSEIVVDTLAELKEKINLKKAIIEAGPFCSLTVIPYQMKQLMTNLITNSLKFSRIGIAPVIQMAAGINDDICHIRFSDNGIGFEEQYQEKIFEVFQRLQNKSDYEGTGIGLSIVKKIIENHNGTIKATSRPGHGATFDIFIPVNHAT
jgi:PAS domain S-box-containing protein